MVKMKPEKEISRGLPAKLRLGIVISGMFFNGVIYGYTSPALPSFQQEEKTQKNFFDEVLPK